MGDHAGEAGGMAGPVVQVHVGEVSVIAARAGRMDEAMPMRLFVQETL